MYLRSLVLKGFKSFADRSVFSFEPGITAIVGPNGSGKSNISDSVLWALGERNAKNLRGQAMEDVIFAGSSARKPVSIAEVSLVLDNSDGTIASDATEIALTRRMTRSGESDYLINNTLARRRDVLDVLHDSGMGTGTNSIIAQGHLAQVLQAKPEERRSLIEEAAGVLKHKQRKERSERKLSQMDTHITRIQDIVSEVERQVRPLERKAKKALQYKELKTAFDKLALQIAVDDLRELQKTWDALIQRETDAREQTNAAKTEIDAAEALSEQLQNELAHLSLDAGVETRRLRRAAEVQNNLDNTLTMLFERKRTLRVYIAELNQSLENYRAGEREALLAMQQAKEEYEQARTTREQTNAALQAAKAEQASAKHARNELQREMDEHNQKRRQATSELEGVRASLAKTREIIAGTRAQKDLLDAQFAEIDTRVDRAQAAWNTAQAELTKSEQALDEARAAEQTARSREGAALTKRNAARADEANRREEVARLQALLTAEEELINQRERANALLHESKTQALIRDERAQSLLEYLRVSERWEAVTEILLGEYKNALVLKDEHTLHAQAQQTHELSQEKTGEVMLISAQSAEVSEQPRPESDEHLPHDMRLISEITYPQEMSALIEDMLGDVLIAEDFDSAWRLAQRYPYARVVTDEGLIIRGAQHVYVCGVSDHESGLSHLRQRDEAQRALRQAQQSLEKASQTLESQEEIYRDAQADVLRLTSQIAELSGARASAQSSALRLKEELASLERQREAIEKNLSSAAETLERTLPNIDELTEREQTLDKTLSMHAREIETLRSALHDAREHVESTDKTLSEARLADASATERVVYAERLRDSKQHDIAQARTYMERYQKQMVQKYAAYLRIDPLIETLRHISAQSQTLTRTLEEASQKREQSTSALHEKIQESNKCVREAHERADLANEALNNLRLEKTRLEERVSTQVKHITDTLGVPLERALEVSPLENRTQALSEHDALGRRLRAMGTINPDAASEYAALKVRFDHLSTQLVDMLNARSTLKRIMSVIDERMRDDFVETLGQVNENFNEIFQKLFPGGEASLSLSDPENIEESGVLVHAQPRGKRIAKMSLMSGGEQSLTALALLFAVYQVRSVPFYILDEVEAALDDSNLRRLCAYLDSVRDETQFIIITHQRRTMEMADVLYGVSMRSDGVTKVMSQRLEVALENAE